MNNAKAGTKEEGKQEIVLAKAPNLSPALTKTSKSLVDLERSISHYPEEIRGEVAWLQGFYLGECQGNVVTLRGVATRLGHERSAEYFNNLIGGYNFRNTAGSWKQGGKGWSEFLEMVEALRRYAQMAARTGQMPFVETPTYQCLADFITMKRALSAVCKFGGITGPTGAQKSESFRFYRMMNNHGAVIHVEAPANGRLAALQAKIAEQYHVSLHKIRNHREEVVRANVNETRTIIIDNVQRLFLPSRGSDQTAFNWLLELQDDTRCTLILSFTTDFVDTLTAGMARGYFEQFVGRMGGVDALLRLPDWAPAADLKAIAKSFGLDAGKGAMEWLHKWSRREGRIRIVFEKLQLAREFAKLDKRKQITLEDLAEADEYRPQAVGSEKGGDEK